jgi:competence protein ComEC
LLVLSGLGIVGFVLLARTETSVVRAAAMGAVGLVGLAANGRDRGPRALGMAVLGLLLWDPWLAVSVGFALSVLATAGILFLAPGWRAALGRWMPDWLAMAISVPAAAQVVCTPVVAAISGEVSLIAVVANFCAGPLVAPATIAGLLGGVAGLLWDPAGRLAGTVAWWSAAGIVEVAERSASTRTPSVDWGSGWVALALLTVVCVAVALVSERVFASRGTTLGCTALLAAVVLVPLPTPGWPPEGWVLAVCDVGQGDALALNAGRGQAVVVDAGPDPALVDRCLDGLDVVSVPMLVVTHFHADHVDGLAGVYEGRRVGEVLVSPMAEPAGQAQAVAREAGGRVRVAAYGEALTIGQLRLQVIGPLPGVEFHGDAADDGSGPNNASVVLLAEVAGTRILLTGDVEPEAQRLLAEAYPELRADVVKIPHHGSRFQDTDWLGGLGAEVAIASAGEDNDYGHPSAETLELFESAGVEVHRTDLDGDVVVAVRDGRRYVATGR